MAPKQTRKGVAGSRRTAVVQGGIRSEKSIPYYPRRNTNTQNP